MLPPKGQIKRQRDVLVLKDICIRAIIEGTTTRKVKKSSRTLLPVEGKIDPAKPLRWERSAESVCGGDWSSLIRPGSDCRSWDKIGLHM